MKICQKLILSIDNIPCQWRVVDCRHSPGCVVFMNSPGWPLQPVYVFTTRLCNTGCRFNILLINYTNDTLGSPGQVLRHDLWHWWMGSRKTLHQPIRPPRSRVNGFYARVNMWKWNSFTYDLALPGCLGCELLKINSLILS